MITDELKNQIISQVLDYLEQNANYVAFGTDGTAPTPSDTQLGNEVIRKPRQEYARDDTNNQITISGWLGTQEANGNTLKELGVFDQSTNGNLLNRDVFTEINKSNQIEVWTDITFKVEVD